MRVATIASLGASAVLGLGALLVARAWLPSPQGKTTTVAAAPVQGVPVVLAAGPIAYGAKLQAKDLVVMQLPRSAVPLNAYSSPAQVLKADSGGAPVALTTISTREPLLPEKLSVAVWATAALVELGSAFRSMPRTRTF